MRQTKISAKAARQGEATGRMRIVLASSLVGAVLAMSAVVLVFG